VGAYAVSASGPGEAGTSFHLANTVNTSVTVAADVNPSSFGQGVTFTATVSDSAGATPGGTVVFLDGTTVLGSGPLAGSASIATATYGTSALAPGSHTIIAGYAGAPGFIGSTNSMTQKVNGATPQVSSWPATASPITYGQTLASSILGSGTASVPGSFGFDAPATLPPAGVYAASVSFTPSDTTNYLPVTGGSVNVSVSPAPLVVRADYVTRYYGAPNPALTGTISGILNGDAISAIYTCSASRWAESGTYPIVPTLAGPEQAQANYQATLVDGALTVLPTTPNLSWTNPAPITYGAALSAAQLNVTADVPGTAVYTPPAGTVLPSGTNTLSVVFTPADGSNYVRATASVRLAVQRAPLTITANDATRFYGAPNPALTGVISGIQNGDPIGAIYSCSAGAAAAPGAWAIVPALLSENEAQTNYQVNLVNGTLTVLPAPPVLTWTNPAPITYGTALGSVQLHASASVPGTEVYDPPAGTVLGAGTNTLSVVFAPADATDYATVTGSVTQVVLPAPLTITANSTSRPYGAANPAFTGTIDGLQNGDAIGATYSCAAGATTPVGGYAIVPSVACANGLQTNYQVTLANGTLTVLAATPAVAWTNPAPITYGAALGPVQLNATAAVPGTLVYNPPAGTVLGVGANTLWVVFTPSDARDYLSLTSSVTVVVLPAPLTIIANDATQFCGAANPMETPLARPTVAGPMPPPRRALTPSCRRWSARATSKPTTWSHSSTARSR
jgi:hypothetical protein